MEIKQLSLKPLDANCYIIRTSDGSAVVIDPAGEYKKIAAALYGMGAEAKKILLTHGHFDHTGAAAELKAASGASVYIHKDDAGMLPDGTKALAFFCPGEPYKPVEPDVLVEDGDTIEQDGITFTVMHTPGHSAGSVCFLTEDENGRKLMFAGDTIFKDSIGRSDTYSGDYMVQQRTLDRISELPDDYIIFPGHGPSTTLNAEKRFNPFLSKF